MKKVPPVGALMKSPASGALLNKCRQSEILSISAASRSSYEKVPPVGDLMKKGLQSELL